MRDALAPFKAKSFRAKSFRAPLAPELLSLCVAKEKVTKEKGHPAWRLPGIVPGKSVSQGRAFRAGIGQLRPALPPLRHPCRRLPARKGTDIPVGSRCAACRPRLTAAQGTPGRAAGHPGPHSVESRKAKSESHSKAVLCSDFASAPDPAPSKSARRERAALPGAPMARRVGEGKPAGWPARMPASFSPAQDVLSKNPVAHPRTRRAGCPQGAPSGWPFSWVTFSLATQRESDSAAEGRRKLLLRRPCPRPSKSIARKRAPTAAVERKSLAASRSALTCRSSPPGFPATASTHPPARTA